MSGSDKAAKPPIPPWQRQSDSLPSEQSRDAEKGSNGNETQDSPPSPSTLLQQAAKFLENDEIQSSSTERKISFLESKGVRNEEIHELLGISRNAEASTEHTPANARSPSSEEQPPSTSSPPSSQPHDVAPIITYPEFLLHSQKPPPLITAQRLLSAVYLTSGVAATIYGTSKYLVSPMIASLNDARHSLFETTSSNLNTLNSSLEKSVSTIPEHPRPCQNPTKPPSGAEEDSLSETPSSTISDPTELFHRDTATQTTSGLWSSPSTHSSSSASPPPETANPSVANPTSSHQARLSIIQSHLNEFLETSREDDSSNSSVQSEIDTLRSYLEGLAYGRLQTMNFNNGYGGSMAGAGSGNGSERDDEIARVKAEIRGVKGVLLSARNFPAGGRGRVGA